LGKTAPQQAGAINITVYTVLNMPKAKAAKRNGSASSSPYTATSRNNIFKMNTDLGQHILKNPGVAQAIVDKADLKQSDVGTYSFSIYLLYFSLFLPMHLFFFWTIYAMLAFD
jgi:hypothetical protein